MSDLNMNLNTSSMVVQGCLIITLPKEMTDEEIEIGINKVLMRANTYSIKGTIFDLNLVSVLDSYSFDSLQKASKSISLMGITVVWIGLRPGVVSALMDLNVDVTHIKAALNLEQGIKMILDAKMHNSRGNK